MGLGAGSSTSMLVGGAAGTISSVEDLGADRFAHVALDGPTEARTVVIRDVRGIIPDPGTRVSVSVAGNDLHYFDQDGQVVQLT